MVKHSQMTIHSSRCVTPTRAAKVKKRKKVRGHYCEIAQVET